MVIGSFAFSRKYWRFVPAHELHIVVPVSRRDFAWVGSGERPETCPEKHGACRKLGAHEASVLRHEPSQPTRYRPSCQAVQPDHRVIEKAVRPFLTGARPCHHVVPLLVRVLEPRERGVPEMADGPDNRPLPFRTHTFGLRDGRDTVVGGGVGDHCDNRPETPRGRPMADANLPRDQLVLNSSRFSQLPSRTVNARMPFWELPSPLLCSSQEEPRSSVGAWNHQRPPVRFCIRK